MKNFRELLIKFKEFKSLLGHIWEVIWISWQAKLRKMDAVQIPHSSQEIRMFLVVRNEKIRLPYLLKYYRMKGVDRFFVVDNGSDDGSVPFLLSQKDVHVFSTFQSYRKANFGQIWMNILLYRYGIGHWCVVGDADELLIFPYSETLSLKDLANYMDARQQTVLNAIVLDMYENKPIAQAKYTSGDDPVQTAPYFDAQGYEHEQYPREKFSGSVYCTGGVRRRVFAMDVCLNKAPFIKFQYNMIFEKTCHYALNGRCTDITATTLHFKYFSSFITLAEQEAKREEHWEKGQEYKTYDALLKQRGDINLYSPAHSVKFQDTQQLIPLNLMKSSPDFDAYAQKRINLRELSQGHK